MKPQRITKLWGRPSYAATCAWVSPAGSRASRKRLRKTRYAADRLTMRQT